MNIQEMIARYRNPLVYESNSLSETLEAARHLLDYLTIMDSGDPKTHVDSSVKYWIGQIAFSALNYVTEELEYGYEVKPDTKQEVNNVERK